MVPKTENKIIINCFLICLLVPQITNLPTGSRMKSAEENGQNFNNQHNLTTRNDLPIICKPGWSFSATWMEKRDLKRRIPANPACLKLPYINTITLYHSSKTGYSVLWIRIRDGSFPNPGAPIHISESLVTNF
jgi:hypothetical protein